MEAKIKRFEEVYAYFVDRPLDGALVVATNDMSTALIAQAVQDLEGRSSSDIALVLADAFVDADSYTDRLVELVQRQQEALAGALDEFDERDRALAAAIIAPLPPPCTDRSTAPATRVQALVAEIHARIGGGDRRITWCLSPAEILDRAGYGRLMAALLAMPRPSGLRLVIRDLEDSPCVPASVPASVPAADESIIALTFSITLDEVKATTARRAADPTVPPEQRLPALIELALGDYGAGRFEEAESRYLTLLAHEGPPPPALCALAWHGLGEIAERRGDLGTARQHLERALASLGERQDAATTYTVTSSLGRVAAALADHQLARECFTCAAALAISARAREHCAMNLDALGDANLALGRTADARNAWTTAAELWRRAGAVDRAHAADRKVANARPAQPR